MRSAPQCSFAAASGQSANIICSVLSMEFWSERSWEYLLSSFRPLYFTRTICISRGRSVCRQDARQHGAGWPLCILYPTPHRNACRAVYQNRMASQAANHTEVVNNRAHFDRGGECHWYIERAFEPSLASVGRDKRSVPAVVAWSQDGGNASLSRPTLSVLPSPSGPPCRRANPPGKFRAPRTAGTWRMATPPDARPARASRG
jgi:hypothetical protein